MTISDQIHISLPGLELKNPVMPASGCFSFVAAFGTPTLAQANPALLFWLLLTSTAVACAIGLFWVPRLPKARELEPVPDDGTAERSSPA